MTTDFVVLTGGILVAGMLVIATLMPTISGFAGQSTTVAPSNTMIQQFATPMALTN